MLLPRLVKPMLENDISQLMLDQESPKTSFGILIVYSQ